MATKSPRRAPDVASDRDGPRKAEFPGLQGRFHHDREDLVRPDQMRLELQEPLNGRSFGSRSQTICNDRKCNCC
jgi:hypothetical protein